MVLPVNDPSQQIAAGTGGPGGRLTQWANAQEQFQTQQAGAGLEQDVIGHELNIMQDQKRFQDMYSATQQAMQLPPEQRTQFLQEREQQLRAQGKDPSETIRFMRMSPVQQAQAAQGMTILGERLGHLNPQAAAAQRKTQVVTIKQTQEDGSVVPMEVLVDKTTGEPISVLGPAEDKTPLFPGQQPKYVEKNAELASQQQGQIMERQQQRSVARGQLATLKMLNDEDTSSDTLMTVARRLLPESIQDAIVSTLPEDSNERKRHIRDRIIAGLNSTLISASHTTGGPMTDADARLYDKANISPMMTDDEIETALKYRKLAASYSRMRDNKYSRLLDRFGAGEMTLADINEELDKFSKEFWNERAESSDPAITNFWKENKELLEKSQIQRERNTGSGDDTGGSQTTDFSDSDFEV